MSARDVSPWYFPDGGGWVYGVNENGEPARGGFAETERAARAALRNLLWMEFGFMPDEARRAVRRIHGQ